MNRKIAFSIIILVFFFASIGGLAYNLYLSRKSICDEVTINTLKSQVPIDDNAKILFKRNLPGLCEIGLDNSGDLVTLLATPDFVIQGDLFLAKKNISQIEIGNYMSGKFRELKKRIDEAVCIYYRPSGEIRHTVYMFEDPKCYYCKEALLKIKGILVKHHADLKILFKASSDSRPIAIDAICRNAGLEKFIEMLYTQTNESERLSCEQGKMLADKASNLAKELYISKVPVFFLENGTMIQGANLTGLEYYLK